MPAALSDYRIIEFGDHPAAAVLGMLLADQGAEVVKAETPEGVPLRGSPAFSVWNRGKMSVSARPDSDGRSERVRRLISSADATIEAGRNPFSADLRGARSVRSDIIRVSLPGFGAGHPHEGVPGDELLVSAATGVYADRSEDGSEGASFIALPYAAIFGAMVAAPALAAALFHRERSGEGQDVAVPLYDAMFGAMGSALVRRPDVPSPPRAISPAIGRFYRCGDGRWINLNATYERSLKPLLDEMGKPHWFAPLTADRLRQNAEERDEWAARFSAAWTERPALEWESAMAKRGVPLTMCRTLREWMDAEHAIASGAVLEIDDPVFGPMRQVGVQVRMSAAPGAPQSPAPGLGQHNRLADCR